MADNHHYLKSMVGKEFKVNRGGHDAVWGKLLDVRSDHLILDTGEGITYFNLQHIKSFNETIGGNNGNGNDKGNTNGQQATYSANPVYHRVGSFNEVLGKMRNSVVTINRGGPEKIEGVLTDANEDYMIVVVNKDIIRVPTYHVKSISLYNPNSNNNNNNNKNDKNDKNDKNKNRSGGKNRSGERSGGRSGGNRRARNNNNNNRGRAQARARAAGKGSAKVRARNVK